MTQDGTLMGSLNYMSPEQMLGRPIDARSDIFSVGSLAYELISFQQAFKGGLNDGLLQRLPHEDPPRLQDVSPEIPAALEQVIMRALQKTPEHRFKDLAEMRDALLKVGQQPEAVTDDDQRTVFIPRAGAAPDSGVVPVDVPSSHSSVAPPQPAVTPDPGAATVSVLQGSNRFGGEAPKPETPAPGSQTWQTKKKEATAPRPPTAVKPPTTATAIPRPPAAARPASSQKWALVAALGALVIGGAAAIPWLMPSQVPPLERERPGIEAAMERFRVGYQNRSMPAVSAVFPALPGETRAAMQREFTACLVYEVTFDEMQVEMAPADESLAHVNVSSTHVCTPKSGARQTTSTQREVFTLRKKADSWSIERVTRSGEPSASRAQ